MCDVAAVGLRADAGWSERQSHSARNVLVIVQSPVGPGAETAASCPATPPQSGRGRAASLAPWQALDHTSTPGELNASMFLLSPAQTAKPGFVRRPGLARSAL